MKTPLALLPSLALLSLATLAPAQLKVAITKPKGTQTERVVLPGETVELFGRISGGSTDAGAWTKSDSGGQTSTLTPDPSGEVHATVLMGPASAPCPFAKSAPFTLSGPVFTTVTLTSAEDPTKTSTQILYSCTPSILAVHTIPSYRTLYASQLADTFSFTEGLVDQSGSWTIAAQPPGGDGALSADTGNRDVVFHATVPGRYRIRRSSPNPAATPAETVYFVSGHPLPYPVTSNGTVPVDPSVDPSLKGKTFDIGPSQPFKSFAAAMHAAGNTLPCGSTFRFINEDTTGSSPTTLHEFISVSEHCPLDQPIRFVGQADRAGHLPVLSGDHATTRPNIPFEYLFDAGAGAAFHTFLHAPSSFPHYSGPQSLIFEGIRVQDVDKDHTFCPAGAAKGPQTCGVPEKNWGEAPAGVHIQSGVAISVNGVDIDGSGNGLFVGFNSGQENWNSLSSDLAFFGDRVSNAGIAHRNLYHTAYLQGRFTVVDGLHVVSYRPGAEGVAAIKTRGSGIIITGSLFEGQGARINDHVEVQDACNYMDPNGMFYTSGNARPTEPFTGGDFASALYTFHHDTWIYGNTYTVGSGGGMFHFAFDSVPSLCSQSGDFHFYNNTLNVRSAGAYRTYFFDSEFQGNSSGRIDQPRYHVVNNVFFNPSAVFYLNASTDPKFNFGKNLMFRQWVGKMTCPIPPNVFEYGCTDDSGWTTNPGADTYTGSSLAHNVTGAKKLIAAATAASVNPQTYRVVGNIPGDPLPPDLAVFPVRFQFSPADNYQKPRSTPVTATTGGLIGSIDTTH